MTNMGIEKNNKNKRFHANKIFSVKKIFPVNNIFLKRYQELGCECRNAISSRPSLRVNTLKTEESELIKRLGQLKVHLEKIPFARHGYYYNADDAKFSLGSTAEYLMGYYYLQEAASQLPAQLLDPQQGETVLDMCASPGGKTSQLAQLMNNTGKMVAADIDSRRLFALRNNLERCGVKNTIIYKKDARFIFDLGIGFDKILLDAPCSGNYVVEEDFFINKSLGGVAERARLQKELLKAAIKSLKKGGVMVYSTCSLEPEENEMNISWLLKKFPEMRLEETGLSVGDPGLTAVFREKLNPEISKCRRFWPERTGTEGFFIAKLVKKA